LFHYFRIEESVRRRGRKRKTIIKPDPALPLDPRGLPNALPTSPTTPPLSYHYSPLTAEDTSRYSRGGENHPSRHKSQSLEIVATKVDQFGSNFSVSMYQDITSHTHIHCDDMRVEEGVPWDITFGLAESSLISSPQQDTDQSFGFTNFISSMENSFTITIKTYAPDMAPSCNFTKILLQFEHRNVQDYSRYRYSCKLENTEIMTNLIAPGVLEFHVPPHAPGIAYFSLLCRDCDNHGMESNCMPFYYTPSDKYGKLSLAYCWTEKCPSTSISDKDVSRFMHTVKELDLSHNDLTNINLLEGFYRLHTLILDNNLITSATKFPKLAKLQTLYVNANKIDNIEEFLDNVQASFPSVAFLSTMNNRCNPLLTIPHQYFNYRTYVISRLPKLQQLDYSPVTDVERNAALAVLDSLNSSNNQFYFAQD